MKKIEWTTLVTAISEKIMKNEIVMTDANYDDLTGGGSMIFDIKNWGGHTGGLYFETLSVAKKQYNDAKDVEDLDDEDREGGMLELSDAAFAALRMKKYHTKEEAIKGHKRIVKYIRENGCYPDDCQDGDF